MCHYEKSFMTNCQNCYKFQNFTSLQKTESQIWWSPWSPNFRCLMEWDTDCFMWPSMYNSYFREICWFYFQILFKFLLWFAISILKLLFSIWIICSFAYLTFSDVQLFKLLVNEWMNSVEISLHRMWPPNTENLRYKISYIEKYVKFICLTNYVMMSRIWVSLNCSLWIACSIKNYACIRRTPTKIEFTRENSFGDWKYE